MSPEHSVVLFVYLKSLVFAVHQRITRKRSIVKAAAGVVEAPILLNAIPSIAIALDGVVSPACAARCHFEHEVGRLADFAYHIAVAGYYTFGVDAESHNAVRGKTLGVVGRFVPQVAFSGNQHVVPVGKVRIEDKVEGDYTY